MKVHRLLVEELAVAIKEIFSTRRHADKILENILKKNRKWGARDRRFFAESTYDLVRWWRLYWNLAGFNDKHYRQGEDMSFEEIIRVWATYWLSRKNEPQDWEEFDDLDIDEIENRKENIKNPAILMSFPDDLFKLGEQEWGSDWLQIAQSLNCQADVYLRVNTLKTDIDTVVSRLQKESINTQKIADNPTALRLTERKNIFGTQAFRDGLFEVQDLGSQKIAPYLRVEPGQRVIDACAGAGGKTLHLSCLMKNKGKILALDVNERKLAELKLRTRRNGVDIVETRWIENSKVIKRLEGAGDRVLLDVPCSGVGVLKRNPDAKWKLSLEEVQRLRELQANILQDYSMMTKVGGLMVYATCSIFPSENDKQVENFLKNNPNWELEKQFLCRPDQHPTDGFFAARLLRKS